ncbi:collagenase [Lysobacter antibioticus]|uniref:collagenase n=1 Tax=Lysobacter antibioticus TaxID=84531 RepID=UPI00034A97F5|nr:collagenase [Lysobacter antibioticus]
MAACTAIIAVAALSTMGGGASGESNALIAAISRATAALTGRDAGSVGTVDSAPSHHAADRPVYASAGKNPRRDGMSGDGTGPGERASHDPDRARFDPRRGPTGTLEMELSMMHSHRETTELTDRGPLVDPELVRLASDYNHPLQPGQELRSRPSKLLEEAARAESERAEGPAGAGAELAATTTATETCDSAQFSNASGSELVSRIKATSIDCLSTLFNLTGTAAGATFPESKMVTVANAIASDSAGYDGTNSTGILNLMHFMQAGYYVQFYQKPSVGEYGAGLTAAIRSALDKFSANANFKKVDDANGEVLEKYFILIDSSNSVTYKLASFKDMYARYGNAWNQYPKMRDALYRTFLVLFKRNKTGSELGQYVQTDTSIITSLHGMIDRNFVVLYNNSYYYLMQSATREMARFMQHSGAAEAEAASRVKSLLAKSSPATGSASAGIWLELAAAVGYYDAANCSAYSTCNYKEIVAAEVLPSTHVCSPTLKIRAQSMLASELAATCAELAGEESFFHSKLKTNNVPVADDNNSALEVIVFNSKRQYDTYGGPLFKIDTSNGGLMMEGDPSASGNQARFYAHEAQWDLPKFSIWNLNHEYVHYLDGRFNRYGDFSASTAYKTVWWIEGLAEYVSREYMKVGSPGGIAEAKLGTYPLSAIFQNDYKSGNVRVYSWGYLAVRYMFEKRPGQVTSILSYLRPGNYSGYTSFMNNIGTSLDVDFKNWLTCVGSVNASGCPGNQLPTAGFRWIGSGLTAQFMDYSTDVDGSIASQAWSFSDGTTASGLLPVKRFAAAGTYGVTLTVVDDNGGSRSMKGSVTVSELPACTDPDTRRLGQNCRRTATTVPWSGTYRAPFYVTVPAGIKQLRITLGGGTGEADLYALGPSSIYPSSGNWVSQTEYMYRSIKPGNGESILIDRPVPGMHTLAVFSTGVASGMTITSQFVTD